MTILSKNSGHQSESRFRNAAVLGPVLMLTSALMFFVLDIIIKMIGPEFRVWDIAFYRWGGGFAVMMIIFSWQGNPFKCNNLKLMVFRSISGCIAFLALTTAIRLAPVSTVMVLFYAFPAFAAVFSYLIFGERISRGEIFCIAAAICGVAVLMDIKLDGNFMGYLLGFIAGAFAGLTVSMIKKLRDTNGPVVIYLYFCLLGAIVALPPYISKPTIPDSAPDWLMIGGIVGTSIVAQIAMNQGFKYCKSWEGGLFLTCEMIFVAFFGIVYLGEPTGWRFWTGGLLILSSVLILNRVKAGNTVVSKNHVSEIRVNSQ
jgi:drug/metabolite transporter (DMT)-like permease